MIYGLILLFVLLVIPQAGSAQFYGAAGLGVTSSSNVSGLDSSIPDVTLDPSLILGYDWSIDHRFRLGLSTGASGNNFQQHSERTSSAFFASVTPTYYLLSSETFFAAVSKKDTANVGSQSEVGSVSERLLKLENWLITVRPKLPKLRGTIDSSQELIGVTRELLSTTAYTTSVKEIILSELRGQLAAMERHNSLEFANIVREWKALIAKLESVDEESDYLPTEEFDMESEEPETSTTSDEADEQLAPLMTMSSTHQSFRDLSSGDFYMLKDRGVLTERSIATTFSLPINWTRQVNSTLYENYTNNQLSISFRMSGMPSDRLQIAGSIDRVGTGHPYDTAYTNIEWRARGTAKLQVAEQSIIGAELGYGSKTYTHPLSFQVGLGEAPRSTVTVGSQFSQVNVGGWFQQFISDDLVMGAVVAAAISPDLKAYVTSVDRTFTDEGRPLDQSVGVAEEDYNYDLFSISAFANSNPIEEIEATLDLTYQARSYGAVDLGTVRSFSGNLEIQRLIASAEGAKRTEDWIALALGASRLFLFEDRLLSIFSGVGIEASVAYTKVTASVSAYSNENASLLLSAAAYF